ncbi:MAG: polysaccharide deacetylase family protein [Cyclobacteriaceae bacterium]|nr:polysaccharide deacetylase family protein [Cyclobacteriaceae bacterium]
MKKYILTSLLFFVLFFSFSQSKKMCITVDDLPTVSYGIRDEAFQLEITQKIVESFAHYNIPAIGYVNEGKLYQAGKLNPSRVKLLELWLESGLELGNHTYSHLNFHDVEFNAFTEDILKGERIIKSLAAKYNSEIKYFRHPYLRIGSNQLQADSLSAFLFENGYIEAPVTIDNEDYLFAKAYSRAYQKLDTVLMNKIGKEYVGYMEEKVLFFETQSSKLFDRNIYQTLLVHASLLNADYMDELIEMYQNHGYIFCSQSEILTDPVYNQKVTYFGNWGISWLDRWALSQGKRGDFFKGDPVTPEFILEINK